MIKSNVELESVNKSRNRLSLSGRFFIDVRVRSPNGFFTDEVGEASGNIKRDYNRLKQVAKLNAIYKHISRGGRSGAVIVKVYGVWFKYFRDDVVSKRVLVKRKGAVRGSYRVLTRDKRGRIVSNDAWSSRQVDDEVVETDVFAYK